MRRLALGALVLTGCSAILGIDDVAVSNPDARLECQVSSDIQLVTAVDGTPGAGVEVMEDGSIFFAARLNLDQASDILGVWLRPGQGAFPGGVTTGEFTIAGADTSFASCGLCVFLAVDFNGTDVSASDFYMANGGTVEITEVQSHFKAALHGLTFRHVRLDTGAKVDDCVSAVHDVTANLTLPAGGRPDAGNPDARPAPDAPIGTPDAPLPADAGTVLVQGTSMNTYINPDDAGQTQVGANLAPLTIQALVPQAGGFAVFPGSGDSNGTFTIPNVPPGPRWVRVGKLLLFTAATQLDFGDTFLGRSDYRDVANNLDRFSVDITGGEEAADGDFFEVLAPNINALFFIDMTVGQTELHDTMYFTRAVDAAKGDRVTITELATRLSSLGEPYRALSRAVTLPPFTTIDNQVIATPATTFATIAQSGTATIDWLRTQFQDARADVNPSAEYAYDSLFLFTMAGKQLVDLYSSTGPDLFQTTRTDLTDVHYGTVHWGNPFPLTWALWSYHLTRFNLDYMAPGATNPVTLSAYLTRIDPLSALSQPLGASLTPATAPLIDGRDAFTPQTGVGASPVLSWSPPRKGAPNGYIVYLYELTNNAGDSTYQYLATMYTTDRSIKIPTGLLANGHTYFTYITAVIAPNAKLAQGPFRRGMPNAYADLLTATFTP